jgi:hypothetical protein
MSHLRDAINERKEKMIRNLKVLGLALVAVFAMSAMVASAASAGETTDGVLTADGPATGDGVEVGKNAFEALGSVIECPTSTYHVEEYLGSGPVPSGESTFTVTPNYTGCTAGGLKATVHMNGCDYDFHIGETTPAGDYYAIADLTCPEGKSVDIEAFLSASNENIKACTVTIGEQTGLEGGILSNGSGDIDLEGTFTNIKASETGLCGSKSTTEGKYVTAVTISGTDSKENATEVSITD